MGNIIGERFKLTVSLYLQQSTVYLSIKQVVDDLKRREIESLIEMSLLNIWCKNELVNRWVSNEEMKSIEVKNGFWECDDNEKLNCSKFRRNLRFECKEMENQQEIKIQENVKLQSLMVLL